MHYQELFGFDKLYRKVKVVPVHAMKAYRGSKGIAPLILNVDNEWR
jgi:hypothetical protein